MPVTSNNTGTASNIIEYELGMLNDYQKIDYWIISSFSFPGNTGLGFCRQKQVSAMHAKGFNWFKPAET